jgi:hypothetical protein
VPALTGWSAPPAALRVGPQVAAREEAPTPVRPEVREAQRAIAALDAAHRHAAGRLDNALALRAEAVAKQDWWPRPRTPSTGPWPQ